MFSVRAMSGTAYKTLAVTQPSSFVTQVELNRPDKFNAFNHDLWMWVLSLSLARHSNFIFYSFSIVHFCSFSIFQTFRDVWFASELKACFDSLSENPDCRSIVLSAAGKYFTAGLDLKESLTWAQKLAEIEDSARKGHWLEKSIKTYQVMNRAISIKSLSLANVSLFSCTLFHSL